MSEAMVISLTGNIDINKMSEFSRYNSEREQVNQPRLKSQVYNKPDFLSLKHK